MKTYGQFCPLAQAAQLLCERWTLLVVREFIAGSTRFSELRKGVPLMSPTLLSARLKQLTRAGVIDRSGTKGKYTYQLTKAGKELEPIVQLLGAWGHRWAPSNLGVGDLDSGLLMWDIRRSVNPTVFPEHRVVVQFEYPDAPKGYRDWWLISEKGEVDLCLSDPGCEVDVLIKSPLAMMTAVWTRQVSFQDVVNKRDIGIFGPSSFTDRMADWLQGSGLSRLGTIDPPEVIWKTA